MYKKVLVVKTCDLQCNIVKPRSINAYRMKTHTHDVQIPDSYGSTLISIAIDTL